MDRPRLVASDVDGTLLDPTDQLSERTRAAVHRVVAAGVPFVLVTGRPPRWIPPIVELLGYAGLGEELIDAVHSGTAGGQLHGELRTGQGGSHHLRRIS